MAKKGRLTRQDFLDAAAEVTAPDGPFFQTDFKKEAEDFRLGQIQEQLAAEEEKAGGEIEAMFAEFAHPVVATLQHVYADHLGVRGTKGQFPVIPGFDD